MHLRDCEEIACASDLQTFEADSTRFANELGFGIINGTLILEHVDGSVRARPFGSIPEAYRSTFEDNARGRRDPVMRRLKRSRFPFVYDQSMYVAEEAADIWEVQAQYGFKTGIALRLDSGPGMHVLIGVDRDVPISKDPSSLTRMVADLHLYAAYAQVAVVRLLGPPQHHLIEDPRLTSRELEILKWTSEGKSAWAVGQILNTSEHTVNYHVRRVMTKLAAGSKHQAAAKARALGLL